MKFPMKCGFCKNDIESIEDTNKVVANYHKQCFEYLQMNGLIP